MSEELKPCSFCGGKAHANEAHKPTRTAERVFCLTCAAELDGPGSIDQWNTRAELSALKAGQGEAVEKILELILDECRYWHGRDEARRGGFAILYTAAKKVAESTTPPTPIGVIVPRELLERLDRMYSEGMSINPELEQLRALLSSQRGSE